MAIKQQEHGEDPDPADVRQMLDRGLIDGDELRRRFEQIEPQLYRFPAIDPAGFRQALDEILPDGSPQE